jgi:hypothetical protein
VCWSTDFSLNLSNDVAFNQKISFVGVHVIILMHQDVAPLKEIEFVGMLKKLQFKRFQPEQYFTISLIYGRYQASEPFGSVDSARAAKTESQQHACWRWATRLSECGNGSFV